MPVHPLPLLPAPNPVGAESPWITDQPGRAVCQIERALVSGRASPGRAPIRINQCIRRTRPTGQ